MSNEDPRRKVFLGMPGYGSVTAGAGRGYWRCASSQRSCVNFQYMQGSLLAQVFNSLWCTALTCQHKGGTVDYFAMQHSDIEPDDFWLDAMIDELEAKGLDVLGAVAPIKDKKGLTSIALGEPDETWRVKCRLSLKEIYRLPETFTSDDVGSQLLMNTGLWVCRFDPAWNKKLHFEINDRIVFDVEHDQYLAQCEPEDWYFSRLCHELGLKLGVTRKIGMDHMGSMPFTNRKPWGQEFDDVYLEESIIPKAESQFQFPHDVPGWLTETEGTKLAELATGKAVLEIGSYCGRSTICLGQTAKSVVSIDPHDGRCTAEPRNTYPEFLANLKEHKIANVISSDGRDLAALMPFDLIFIDGSHAYDDVARDIQRCHELIAPDGLIVFHDYHRECDPDVTRAVDEYISAGAELLNTTDTLAVVRPPASIPLEV